MTYLYTIENRLETPHSYMYVPYEGKSFLIDYIEDRKARIKSYLKHQEQTVSTKDPLITRLSEIAYTKATKDTPDAFEITERTELRPLLASLLGAILLDNMEGAKPWLARIIQRFEVNKRLYPNYAPGFRKGEGEYNNKDQYYEFALCLALGHVLSGNLQYLSTLLKINDLLLSLSSDELKLSSKSYRIEILVEAELSAVAAIAKRQGIRIDGV